MAIQLFFKPRRPRTFQHKLIYSDPRKEALDRRIERIRNELIDKGEIEGEKTHRFDTLEDSEDGSQRSERIRGRFTQGTEHLQRQVNEGVDAYERTQRIIRLMLMLLGLGFAVWFFVLR